MNKKDRSSVTVPDDDHMYATTFGTEIHIKPISLLDIEESRKGVEKAFAAAGEPVEPPTYKVALAGGTEAEYPLTEDNLFVENDEAETKRRMDAWDAHTDAKDRMQAEIGRMNLAIILDAVDADLPEDNAWIAQRKKRYIEVPDDLDERLTFYKINVLLVTPFDLIKVQERIMEISSGGLVDREAVAAAGDMFLRQAKEEINRSSRALAAAQGVSGEGTS